MHIFLLPFTAFRFKSNYFVNGLGFKLWFESSTLSKWSYSSGACGGNFTTANGLLTSPSYPNNYLDDADCVYIISRPNGSYVNLAINNMDIEHEPTCAYDYLEIRDGNSEESPIMRKLCGNEIPPLMQSAQNNVWMRYRLASQIN